MHPIVLANRMELVEESATLAMAQKAQTLQEKGIKVISLSLGEPDFNTFDAIKESAVTAVHQNFSHYSPVGGFLSTRKAVCEKLQRDNGLTYDPNQIVIGTGAKQVLYNLFQVLLNPSDEVILPSPYWVSYQSWAVMCGAKVVHLPTDIEHNFKFTPQDLEKAISPKTKFFIFNSPSNPTGTVYEEDEIRAFGEVLKKHPHVYIISDEIYEYIRFGGKHFSFAQIDELYERVLLVHGVSKGYAMTGYRIGFVACATPIAKACVRLQSQITSGTCSIAQKAAEKAFLLPADTASSIVNIFKDRRDAAVSILSGIEGLVINRPEGAFYLFPKISAFFGRSYQGMTVKNSKDLALFLLEYAHVATVDGESFGAPDYIRLSYAVEKDLLIKACENIKKALELLQQKK